MKGNERKGKERSGEERRGEGRAGVWWVPGHGRAADGCGMRGRAEGALACAAHGAGRSTWNDQSGPLHSRHYSPHRHLAAPAQEGRTPAATRLTLRTMVKDVQAALADNVMFKRLLGSKAPAPGAGAVAAAGAPGAGVPGQAVRA